MNIRSLVSFLIKTKLISALYYVYKFSVHTFNPQLILLRGTSTQSHKTAKIIFATKAKVYLNSRWVNVNPFKFLFLMGENAKLIVNGNFNFLYVSSLYINEGATLELGNGYCNFNSSISCFKYIKIGDGVFISENVMIRDSDDNELVGSSTPVTQPILIRNHVWIGARATILKGVTISDGAIIAEGALVNKNVPANTLVGSVPTKIINTIVIWK